jgi:hypothetical protein
MPKGSTPGPTTPTDIPQKSKVLRAITCDGGILKGSNPKDSALWSISRCNSTCSGPPFYPPPQTLIVGWDKVASHGSSEEQDSVCDACQRVPACTSTVVNVHASIIGAHDREPVGNFHASIIDARHCAPMRTHLRYMTETQMPLSAEALCLLKTKYRAGLKYNSEPTK